LQYQLRQSMPELNAADLRHQLTPLFSTLFPGRLTEARLQTFLEWLEERTEEVVPQTPDCYGHALVEVGVHARATNGAAAGAVWLSLPDDAEAAVYRRVSAALQLQMRRMTADAWFQSLDRYADRSSALLLLAWSSLPAVNGARLQGGKLRVTNDKVHFDFMDTALVTALLRQSPQTAVNFAERLKQAEARLASHAVFAKLARDYRPRDAASLLASVRPDDPRLRGLLLSEATLVDSVVQCGLRLARFRAATKQNAEAAVEELARFGSELSRALHEPRARIFLGPAARAMGSALFLEVLRAVGGESLLLETSALMRLLVLKPAVAANAVDAFLATGAMQKDAVAVEEQVTSR
jgi:hypothetical protein